MDSASIAAKRGPLLKSCVVGDLVVTRLVEYASGEDRGSVGLFPVDRWLSRPLSGEFFEGPSKLFGVDRAGIERLAGPL
jgi:hypothetical protein